MVRFEPFVTYDFGGFHNRTYYDLLGKEENSRTIGGRILVFHTNREFITMLICRADPKFRFSDGVSYNTFGTDARKKLRFQAGVFCTKGKIIRFHTKNWIRVLLINRPIHCRIL